jgi:hypothetical protein
LSGGPRKSQVANVHDTALLPLPPVGDTDTLTHDTHT